MRNKALAIYIAMLIIASIVAINMQNVSFYYVILPAPPPVHVSNPKESGSSGFVFVMGIFLVLLFSFIAYLLKNRKHFGLVWGHDIFTVVIAGILAVLYYSSFVFIFFKFLGNKSMSIPKWRPISGGEVINFFIICGFLIILFVVILYIAILNVNKREKKKERKESRTFVDKVLHSVKIGDDVRKAILRAYKEMENMMQSRGIKDEKHYTPREFEKFALNTLKLSPEPVETLVSLFEDARYSDHMLTDEDRRNAITALEAIRNELSK